MNIKDIRRKNLQKWVDKNSIPQIEKSYFSQILGGSASFGEKAARRIERDYAMPSGYLDDGIVEVDSLVDPGPTWPFARISKDRFMSLSETQRAFIEGAVLAMVDREIERNAEAEPNRSAG